MSGNRIALRPFENLSGDPSQDVLARGLGLDLATELSRFATLEVIPATSVPTVRVTVDSPDERTPLFVLAGEVRRIEQHLRISARLTEDASGRQVWAERFDAPAAEILAVQDDIV